MTPIITIKRGLPFVSAVIYAKGQKLSLNNVLLDTGSAGTVFRTVDLEGIGILLETQDVIREMTGIGGGEYVVEKQIDALEVGDVRVSPFVIQLGALDYGMSMEGILGVDFLPALAGRGSRSRSFQTQHVCARITINTVGLLAIQGL